jgi:hypothetical protein
MLINQLLRRWKAWLDSLAEETVTIAGVKIKIGKTVISQNGKVFVLAESPKKIIDEVDSYQQEWFWNRAWKSLFTDISAKERIVLYYKSLNAYQGEVQKLYQETLKDFPMMMVDEEGSYIGKGVPMNGDGSSWIQKGVKEITDQIYFSSQLDSGDDGESIKPNFFQKIWPSHFRAAIPKNREEEAIFRQSPSIEKIDILQCLEQGKKEVGDGGFRFEKYAPRIFAAFDRTEKNYQRLQQLKANEEKVKEIKKNCLSLLRFVSALEPNLQAQEKNSSDKAEKLYDAVSKFRSLLEYEFDSYEQHYNEMVLVKDAAMQKFLTQGFVQTRFDDMKDIDIDVEMGGWARRNREIDRSLKVCHWQTQYSSFLDDKSKEIKSQLADLNKKYTQTIAVDQKPLQHPGIIIPKDQNTIKVQENKNIVLENFSLKKAVYSLGDYLKYIFLKPSKMAPIKTVEDEKIQNSTQITAPGLTRGSGEE